MNLEQKILENIKPYMGMPVALSGGIDSSLLAALLKPKFVITTVVPGEDERFNELKYAKMVAEHLGIEHIVVEAKDDEFEEDMKIAVKAIGRPIPHFNIFTLFQMYKKLNEMGVKEIVLGDAPDETMCGYARDLIINYLYKVYDFEAFKSYKPMIDKILPPISKAISAVIGKETDYTDITKVDIELMRADMDDMTDGIAKHFGIVNHRPYQDNKDLDDFMRDLPMEEKIHDVEFGKYALRKIVAKYLPEEIAWRKTKVGGTCYPVNKKMGWLETEGDYGKNSWMNYQKNILQ